jgi:hypothetical protein
MMLKIVAGIIAKIVNCDEIVRAGQLRPEVNCSYAEIYVKKADDYHIFNTCFC